MGKAGSQPLDFSPILGFTLVSYSLACKYYNPMEVTVSGKHSRLLPAKITAVKSVLRSAPGACIIKLITAVIYGFP
jgi:hypothetical protein